MLGRVGRFLAVGAVCLGFAVGAEAQTPTITTYQVFGEGDGTTVTVEDGVLRYESSVTGTITVTVLAVEATSGVDAKFNNWTVTIITPDHCALVGEHCPVLDFTGWADSPPDAGQISKILAAGATLTATAAGGFQAIHYAASVDSTVALSALISMGASVDARADGGYTPAHIAASVDATAALAELISMGADVNARGDDGYTPLHIAAQSGAGAALSLLLTNDAALTAEAADGSTPADLAKDADTRAALTAVVGAVLFCTHNCAAGMSPYQISIALSVTLQNRIARGESRHAAFVFAEGGFVPRGSAYIYNAATDANASVWVTPGPSIVTNTGDAAVTMPGTASVFVSLRVPAVVTATVIADDLPDSQTEAWRGVSHTRAATAFFTVSSQIANANYAASGNNAARFVTAGVFALIGTITGATKPRVSLSDSGNFHITAGGGGGAGTALVAAAVTARGTRTLTVEVSPQSPSYNNNTLTARWTVDVFFEEDEVLLVGGAQTYTSGAAAQANSIIWAAPATNVASGMWSARATLPETRLVGHKAVNFNGTIVVAGGRVVGEGGGGANVDGSNRVLWSADRGRTWNQYNAPWPKRREFGMVVHRGSLYVIAGYSPTPSSKSLYDTWRTGNISQASGWTQIAAAGSSEYNNALGFIRAPNAVSYRGNLLVIGGNEFLEQGGRRVARTSNGRVVWTFNHNNNRWGLLARNTENANINAGGMPQESGGEAIVINNNTVFIMGLFDLEKIISPSQPSARENNTVYFYDALSDGQINQARLSVWGKCGGSTNISQFYPSALHFRNSIYVFGGNTRQIRRLNENPCPNGESDTINVAQDSSETTPANTQNTRAVFVGRAPQFFQRINEVITRPFFPPRFHLHTVFAAPSAITVPAGLQVSIHLMSFVPQGTPPFTILTPNNFPELTLGLRQSSVYHLSYQGAWPSQSRAFNVLVDAVQFQDGEENMITLSFTLYAGTPPPIRYEFPNNARIVRGESATVTASIGGGVIGAYAFSYGGRNLTEYSAASVLLNGNISMSIAANTPANFGLFRVIAVAVDRRTSESNPNAPRGRVTVDIPIIDERLSVGVLSDGIVTIAANYTHAGYHLASITARGGVGAYSYSLAGAPREYGVSETGAVSLKLRAGGYRGLTTLTIRVSDGAPPVSRDAYLTVQSETYRPLSAQVLPSGSVTLKAEESVIAGTLTADGGIFPYSYTISSPSLSINAAGAYYALSGTNGYTLTTTLTAEDSALGIFRRTAAQTITLTAVASQ